MRSQFYLILVRIYEEREIVIFSIINNHINRSLSPTEMPEESIGQISYRAFSQDKPNQAFIISNHLRTSLNCMQVDQPSLKSDYVLNPPSIFNEERGAYTLDRYFKIKMLDKPKDTLAQIMSRKQEFQLYIKGSLFQQIDNQAEVDELNHQLPNQSRQIYEHTFAKHVESQTILVVKITPSIRCKCNIVVYNLRGEVLKYYRNGLLIKKGGKILKIFKQFQNQFLFVLDHCYQEFDNKYFLPFLKENFYFCYNMAILPQFDHFGPGQIEEIQQKYKAKINKQDYNLEVLKLRPNYLFLQEMLEQVQKKFLEKQKQQQQYLIQLRGFRNEENRDLSFDLMAVNMWKQSGQKSQVIAHKIKQLFDMKADNVSSMIPQQNQTGLHLPSKTEKEQNCVHCLSINLNKLKPRRTIWICKVCSAEMQKPIYLCRKCFGEYHKNTNVPLFRKNQKKTKKTLKIKRRLMAHKSVQLNIQKNLTHLKQEEPLKTEDIQKEELCNRLNQLQEEFFDKIGTLIEEGQENKLKSCNFYLNMLLNTNIKCLKKIEQQTDQKMQSQ